MAMGKTGTLQDPSVLEALFLLSNPGRQKHAPRGYPGCPAALSKPAPACAVSMLCGG